LLPVDPSLLEDLLEVFVLLTVLWFLAFGVSDLVLPRLVEPVLLCTVRVLEVRVLGERLFPVDGELVLLVEDRGLPTETGLALVVAALTTLPIGGART